MPPRACISAVRTSFVAVASSDGDNRSRPTVLPTSRSGNTATDRTNTPNAETASATNGHTSLRRRSAPFGSMHCFYRTWFTHSKPGVGNRPAGAENLIRADHGRLTATAESCRRRGLQHGSDRRAFLAALLHRLPRQVLHRL